MNVREYYENKKDHQKEINQFLIKRAGMTRMVMSFEAQRK